MWGSGPLAKGSKMTSSSARITAFICGALGLGASVVIFSYIFAHGGWFLSGSNPLDHMWHFFLGLLLAQISQSSGDYGYKMLGLAFK